MAKTQETLNLYQKLAKIRKQVEVIQKNRAGYGYKYVSEDEILARVTVYMDRYALSLYPRIVPETTVVTPYSYTKTKGGKTETANEILVQADVVWTWVNNDDPTERLEIPWSLVGQQGDASQAFGSGLTYSDRYFLLKFFNIATPDEDPDAFRSKQKQAEENEDKMIADEFKQAFDRMVHEYLESGGKPEDVRAYVTGFRKDGDYRKINDISTLSRLCEGFEEKFLSKKED